MGLRRVVMGTLGFLLMLAATAGAAPQEPVVFAVAWGEVHEQFFPHPSLCVGSPTMERQREAGPGFRFDPDGCTDGEAVVAFVDADGSGALSADDPLYVMPRGEVRVAGEHLRLGPGAPVVVQPSESDVGRNVRHLAPVWDFVDSDRSGRWSGPDTAYFDADENGLLSPGDLVLDDGLRRVPIGAEGMFYKIGPAQGGLCFVDDDGSGAWSAGEPAYLVLGRACDHVAAGDLRIVTTRGQQPGTRVIEAAFDFRNPLTAFEAPQGVPAVVEGVAVMDLDGSGTLTKADRLVAGLSAPAEPDGAALMTGGAWAFLDLDQDGLAGPRDMLYIDRDHNGRSSEGDVRFHQMTGHAFGSIVAAGDVDDVAALPAKQQPASAEESGRNTTGGDEKKTPAPAFTASLLALFGFLALVRRSRS